MSYSSQRLEGEHIDLLHRQMPMVLSGHLLTGSLLVLVLWGTDIGHGHMLIWLAVLWGGGALRWSEARRYNADPDRYTRLDHWRTRFLAGAALSGITWGYIGWAFFQPTLYTLFPIALVLPTLVALSVPSVGIYFPAHLIFNLLTLMPFLARALAEGSQLLLFQAFPVVVTMVSCLIFSWRQQATIRESIRLRFANLDLLDQIREENEIAEMARRQAEDANAAKSRFLAAASHDLRQPIQAMELFVSVLREDLADGRNAPPELVDKIAASSGNLGMLLDALMDLSRADAGSLPLDVRDLPLRPLFDRIRDEFSDQAAARGLRLRVVPTHCLVHSDAAALERILRNLVSNALRYTERGCILVACRRRGDGYRIEVRDSGIGIAADQQQAIFGEFYQVGNPERDRRKGLGLGLAIVHALTQQLGSAVTLRSEPGRGSTFAFQVPAASSAAVVANEALDGGDRLRGLCIAVIDDDPEVREALAALVTRWGCRPATGANSGEILQALAATQRPNEPPAAIVADLRLRENRSGPAEARALHRHFGRAIPTLIVTGDTTIDDAVVGDFPVLRKPVQGLRLRARLDALLAAKSAPPNPPAP
ncbi:MAG: hybrid sensor histidine kinase/response regulator [Alphaproteobacteria bacterium CG_4_10_14_0_2_um_filter_63_37]|nr:MAG: hypothetical protein AUJ55_03235 [Proteobacteria bacterium CG1_02_64_396]PJA23936.1 MAG: hybrid sensor histidine kinase/response regulator [Alphaproteobacteria bacterium CG_4_10_14_0_2_um_filter_63_37]